MQAFDYIFVSMLMTNLMISGIFLIAWFTIERKPHTFVWSMVFLVAALNMLLNASRGLFPDRNIYWVIVCASTLFMQALGLAGYRLRAGLKPFPLPAIGFFVAVQIALSYFTLIQPHMGLRMVMTLYSGAIVGVLCCLTLCHSGKPLRPAEWGVIGIFALYAISEIASGTVALMQGAKRDEYWMAIYQQINFLVMPAAFSGLGLFTVLILADDLAVRMRKLATTDQLTSLLNRRGFFAAADNLLEDCRRRNTPVFLALTDIDRFKKINDRFGHHGGDIALQRFAQLMQSQMRRSDILARLGGEEFAILISAKSMQEAHTVVERLRTAIEGMLIVYKGNTIPMTASFGLMQINLSHHNIFEDVNNADELLYQAKKAGRNKTVATKELLQPA